MQQTFQALASKPRLEIIEYLLEEDTPLCYCELEDVVDKDRSVIYRHLKKLEQAGLLKTEKKGKRVECELKNKQRLKKLLNLAKEVKKR